jgi:hypothetical protein
MIKRLKIGDLVLCEWEDSYGCSPTWEVIEADKKPHGMMCKSVGWLIRKSKRWIVIVPHLSENTEISEKQGCGDMTIPTAAIVRLKSLHAN